MMTMNDEDRDDDDDDDDDDGEWWWYHSVETILPAPNADGIFLYAILAEQDDSDDNEQTADHARHKNDCRQVRRKTGCHVGVVITRRLWHVNNIITQQSFITDIVAMH